MGRHNRTKTGWTYDAAGRNTSEFGVGAMTNRFASNGADEQTGLCDGIQIGGINGLRRGFVGPTRNGMPQGNSHGLDDQARVVVSLTWDDGAYTYGEYGTRRYRTQNGGEGYLLMVYDGMLVVQERNTGTPAVTYTRGVDLSGSLDAAGGIGGLLARSHGFNSGTGAWSTHNAYHADGNGNVTALFSTSTGSQVAWYRYDAFGRQLQSSGSLASANRMRFSSKPWMAPGVDDSAGMYYYGYRFYEPLTQRWVNRDPFKQLMPFAAAIRPNSLNVEYSLGVRLRVSPALILDSEFLPGGANVYKFCNNSPIDCIDPNGEWPLVVGGAIFGGLANGLCNLVQQARSPKGLDFKCVNWGQFGRSVAVGAIGGAVAGALIPGVAMVGVGEAIGIAAVGGTVTGAGLGITLCW